LCGHNKAGYLAFVVVEVIPFTLLVIRARVGRLLALVLAVVLDAIVLVAAAAVLTLTAIDAVAALALAELVWRKNTLNERQRTRQRIRTKEIAQQTMMSAFST